MTGFGSAESTHEGWTLKAECRSVNHRGLDVKVWAPRDWNWVEPFVQETVRATLFRGRIEVRVDVSAAPGESTGRINFEKFASVAAELRRAAQEAELAPPTAADVLGFAEVVDGTREVALPVELGPFKATIRAALEELAASRQQEGERLAVTMEELVSEVDRRVIGINAAAAEVADEYRTRLEQRVREALARFDVGELDERAILHEVALYADRSDVSEELQRAASHVEKLREVFAAPAVGAVGKQVDFYLQELIREANTTGSKSGSLAITDHVIAMKTAIEQMREQAANIE